MRWQGIVCLLLVALAGALVVVNVDKYGRRAVMSDGPSTPLVIDSRPVVLFLGDSYTAGTGAGDGRPWVDLVADRLGWVAVNMASGGTGFTTPVTGQRAPAACGQSYCPSFTEAAVRAADSEVFDIIVVSGGRNDSRRPLDLETRSVEELLATLDSRFEGVPVLATNPLWDSTTPPRSLDNIAAALNRSPNLTLLSLGQPLAGRPDLVSQDKVHPNARGHEAIAAAFLAEYASVR